ncbi:hypothetical protein COO60DRAFT_1677646 [Scenedesmus sp. NREL 46B-D3]|nr:hypothetical protein COO60DRAFT_1677646 [Scenedesmus sp. NREL 46B-D3]
MAAVAARENLEAMTLLDSIKPGAVPTAAVCAALADAVQQQQTQHWSRAYTADLLALVGMPIAQQGLDAAQLLILLHAALEAQNEHAVKELLQLPAAKQLQWAACEALLSAALVQWGEGAKGLVSALMQRLPALSASVKFDHVRRIFEVAAQQYDDDGLLDYIRLPAVQTAASAQLQQLLLLVLEMCGAAALNGDAVVSVSSIDVFHALLDLPCAQRLECGMIRDLLEASFGVVQQAPKASAGASLASAWTALCQLPRAHSLDHATTVSLLRLSLARPCSGPSAVALLLGRGLVFRRLKVCRDPAVTTKLLLQLPAAAVLPALDLVQLTACVVLQCSHDVLTQQLLQQLLDRGRLPGPDELASLITICLQERTEACAAVKHPAAVQGPSSTAGLWKHAAAAPAGCSQGAPAATANLSVNDLKSAAR